MFKKSEILSTYSFQGVSPKSEINPKCNVSNVQNNGEAGLAYAGILFLLLIVSTMALAFLFKVGTETAATEQRGKSIQAHYLAEAAANHAMWRLLNEPVGDVQVAHSHDDAHEEDAGDMYLDNKNLLLGSERWIGLRFLNIKIPQGARIIQAYVEFKASHSDDESTHVQIYGHNTDDAAPFTLTKNNIQTRSRTGAVPWNNIPNWTKDKYYQTPYLTSIIQTIVNRPAWSSGNALAIIFKSTDLSGERRAYAYDHSPGSAALLRVAYEGGPLAADNVYYMHSLAGGRYGYKVRRHSETTFATIATVGAIGDHVVHQSYVLYVKPTGSKGCHAEYVEMYQAYTPTVQGSWQVLDLSGDPFNVPPKAVLEVAITNTSGSSESQGGVRAVGSTLNRWFNLHEAESGGVDAVVMHVQADSSSQIEYFAETGNSIEFTFFGYWTCANYVETFVSFKAGVNGWWWNHNLGTSAVGPNQVAEVVIANTNQFSEWNGGVRKAGSTLHRVLDNHEPESGGVDTATMLVEAGGDENASIQVYSESDWNIDFYLVGYWSTPPGTYTELNDTLGSPLVDQTWEDADLSGFGVPADAVAQIAMANGYQFNENYMGLKEKGSSLQRIIELHEAEGGGYDIATIHVNAGKNSTIEWYHEDVSAFHEYRLLGYWECMDTLRKDLAGHWKLDEHSGTTASDSSAHGNDGTLVNMDPATDWVPGQIDGALEFDGATEYILVPHDPSLSLINQLTVAAWIYKESTVGYDIAVNKGTWGNNHNYRLGTLDDEITFGFYDGAWREFNTSGVDLQTDTWYHVAATFNNANNSVRVYLNGSEVNNWSPTEQPLTNTDDLYIGRTQSGEYWDGKLDDVRIYNRTLDQAEIQALYNEGS
jgi:hypothetical protein